MSPALFPAFDPTITDYVVSGVPGSPVQVTINAPYNMRVSVDGQPFLGGMFTVPVSVSAGQSFMIATKQGGVKGQKNYTVRCLPPDFIPYTVQHTGQTQAEWYIVVPDSFAFGSKYVTVFDPNGVPLWWYADPARPFFATLLRDGNLAWNNGAGVAVERALDGTLLHTITPASALGGGLDLHELLLLPNGNYVYIVDIVRGPVDLSAEGGSSSANVIDCVIEEVTPSGQLVWSWSAMDHISPAETDPQWWPFYLRGSLTDPYHMNSVEPDGTGTGYVISCRHLDAIMYIDKATGNIQWKLGGMHIPQSLTFVGDPYSNFGGQHDARVRPASCVIPDKNGILRRPQLAVALHDDRTLQNGGVRAVQYLIDVNERTATLMDMENDPQVPYSGCCGSARKLPTGDWIASWGDTNIVAEYNDQGQRVFELLLPNGYLSYRTVPVPPGELSRAALRAGMDAQYPR
jgi:hypothetical protein